MPCLAIPLIDIYIVSIIFRALNSIGIENMDSYRDGEWYGNSSSDPFKIFNSVTYNFSDLVERLSYQLKYRGRLSFKAENFEFLGIRTIHDRYYGRCFEIVVDNENENVNSINLEFKQSIFIYVSIPFRFLDFSTQSKIQGNINEDLFMEVNYEVHKNNYGKSCRKYSNTHDDSYDECKLLNQKRSMESVFNCTVPFLAKVEKDASLCHGSNAKEAITHFRKTFGDNTSCADPCDTMISWFGYPFVNKQPQYNGTGKLTLYFRKDIKVTEDFISI